MARIRIGFGILAVSLAAALVALVLMTRRTLDRDLDEARFAVASQVIARVDAELEEIARVDDQRALRGDRETTELSALGYFERYPDGKVFSPAGLTSVIQAAFSTSELPHSPLFPVPGETVRLGGPGTVMAGFPLRSVHPTAYDIISMLATVRLAVPARNDGRPRHVEARPLAGMRVDDDTILLFRAIVGGPDRMHAEGVALDLGILERQLRSSLGDAARFVEIDLTAGGPETLEHRSGPVIAHRFSEPFDPLLIGVSSRVLPQAAGGSLAWALVALTAVALALALAGSYRASAVAVRDAERRSRFATLVTHELRTPLTAIRMSAEILEQGVASTDAERSTHYRSLLVESERLSRLVEGVLELARLRRGGRELRLVPASLSEVVTDAVGPLERIAAQRGFDLEVAAEPDLPPVLLERDAVVEVLQNLVDNAVRHGEGAPRVVHVSCGRAAHGREVVTLRVRDHGPGVPREQLAHLFEGAAGSRAGLGMGLALVGELAVRMRATVSAALPAGGGLEVTIAFPITDRDEAIG